MNADFSFMDLRVSNITDLLPKEIFDDSLNSTNIFPALRQTRLRPSGELRLIVVHLKIKHASNL